MDRLQRGFREELKMALIDKSSGVFLWIVLVVLRILTGLVHYEDRRSLMARVDELPSDLEDLYDHMFSNMSPSYQWEGSILLQLISRAHQVQTPALTALEYAFAIDNLNCILTDSIFRPPDLEEEDVIISMLAGKLRSRCSGLIEIEDRGPRGYYFEPKAKFLHRTVYDYLQNPFVWEKLYSICKIERLDMDHSLLAACSFLIQRSATDAQSMHLFDDSSAPASDYLTACVQYAEKLNRAGDTEYFKQLCTADEYLRERCNPTSGFTTTHERMLIGYNKAWQEAMSRSDLAEVCDRTWHTGVAEPDWTSLFAASQLGLAAYVEWQISSTAAREKVYTVAIQLFQVMTGASTSTAKRNNSVRAIQLILSSVTKANKASSFSHQLRSLWTEWLLMHDRRIAWLERGTFVTAETLAVTLSLLEAVRQSNLSEERAIASQNELVHILKACKSDTTDLETISTVTRILSFLDQSMKPMRSTDRTSETAMQHRQCSPKAYMHPGLSFGRAHSKISCNSPMHKNRCTSMTSSSSKHSNATGTFSMPHDRQSQLIATLKRLHLENY